MPKTPPGVAAVTSQHCQDWYDSLKCKEDTRQTYMRWLKAFFKWLVVEEKKLRANPCSEVKLKPNRPKARKNTIDAAQVAMLIKEAADDEMRFVLYCGFHAGMRKGEIIASRPGWFDLKTRVLTIQEDEGWRSKDRENRTVPITREFCEFLAGYGLPAPFMLAPEVKPGRARYRYDFRRPWTELMKRCGVVCSVHDARRTFTSLRVSAGVSIYKVAKWLGDGVAVVEKHYGWLQPDGNDIERGL
jgi:integrase